METPKIDNDNDGNSGCLTVEEVTVGRKEPEYVVTTSPFNIGNARGCLYNPVFGHSPLGWGGAVRRSYAADNWSITGGSMNIANVDSYSDESMYIFLVRKTDAACHIRKIFPEIRDDTILRMLCHDTDADIVDKYQWTSGIRRIYTECLSPPVESATGKSSAE